jgi:hypothetical protein
LIISLSHLGFLLYFLHLTGKFLGALVEVSYS